MPTNTPKKPQPEPLPWTFTPEKTVTPRRTYVRLVLPDEEYTEALNG